MPTKNEFSISTKGIIFDKEGLTCELILDEFVGVPSLELETKPYIPGIKEVIFHNPATIVYWKDGSKTVVKCENELYDKEKGLAMAIVKKSIGLKEFFKWIDED